MISNPNPDTGVYSTEFADESSEYFDAYAEVQTRYSQVYWTRSPDIPLPPDLVKRFEGKVMAITGYEVDQVMKTPDGDKSVPIYNAYNHHYFGWLMGDHSEMFRLDEPKSGQNPTYWDIRDSADKPADLTYPTNIVFKENPGAQLFPSFLPLLHPAHASDNRSTCQAASTANRTTAIRTATRNCFIRRRSLCASRCRSTHTTGSTRRPMQWVSRRPRRRRVRRSCRKA
jgi:hypothetical protein